MVILLFPLVSLRLCSYFLRVESLLSLFSSTLSPLLFASIKLENVCSKRLLSVSHIVGVVVAVQFISCTSIPLKT